MAEDRGRDVSPCPRGTCSRERGKRHGRAREHTHTHTHTELDNQREVVWKV